MLPNENIKRSTMGRHRWALNILRADVGSTKVRALSPQRVEKALTDRAHAGYSRTSSTNILSEPKTPQSVRSLDAPEAVLDFDSIRADSAALALVHASADAWPRR